MGQEGAGDAMHLAIIQSEGLTLDENTLLRQIELHSQMDELIAATVTYMKHSGIVSEDSIQETWQEMHAEYLVSKIKN
jgi:hypothetical protein